MLWSPNEVIAYLKDDLGVPSTSDASPDPGQLHPTQPFGGFKTWPSTKEDFVLIAENSEIHGPNPLFTIPKQDSSVDLNALSTQILSADYQGVSNNKILPGQNAQLLMPDLASDLHVAVNYFFLFDSEARGFVRPTCLAYFTPDKYKLVKLAESILKCLAEASEILQHSNVLFQIGDLRNLRDSLQCALANAKGTASKEMAADARLKDIVAILNLAETYEGNNLFSQQTMCIMEYLKRYAAIEKVQNFGSDSFSSLTEAFQSKENVKKSPTKKLMKHLHLICGNGLVLSLYHLYITHKHFRRKYETIAVADTLQSKGGTLYFGACIKESFRYSTISQSQTNTCPLYPCRLPTTFSLESKDYFECLDVTFEKVLIDFIDWQNKELKTLNPDNSFDVTDSGDFNSTSSYSSGYVSNDSNIKENDGILLNCRHAGPLNKIWDSLDYIKKENPGIEIAFLKVLRLFDDTQKIMFALLTRVPVIVISTQVQQNIAQYFIKALSVFVPQRKDGVVLVDTNRRQPLKKEELRQYAAINICVQNEAIGDLLPLDTFPSLCILNLKDCSLTAPAYSGCILANVNQQIRAISSEKQVFPVLVSIFLEVERTLHWWQMVTSSAADTTTVMKYVLSKGLTRLDMHIIEKLSKAA